MAKTAKEKLSALIDHNTAIHKGDKYGTLKKVEVQDAYQENLENFAKETISTRSGLILDKHGRKLPSYDVSLAEAITDFFGIRVASTDAYGNLLTKRQQDTLVIKSFLKQNDVRMGIDSLTSTAQRFGHANLTVGGMYKLMDAHSSFDGVNNTSQIPSDYRFIIAELVLAAIRLDYEANSAHTNWIGSTVNISQRTLKMPHIKRGNATPRKIGEAESIPFGTVAFGQKSADVFKVGIGFKLTDELIEDSSIDMMFEFLGEVGTDMAIASDVEASRVLLNGEQASLSESAPVIGVKTVGTFSFRDLKLAISRMARLKRNVNRIITSENDGVDISLLEEFKGFAGETTLANLKSILGVPQTLANDVFTMPSNQIMLLDPMSAMFKLQYGGMKTEDRRNPQTQEQELFVSDYVGFAIKRRDGRIIIDKSLDIAAQSFPSYMDIDARISAAYKTIQE